jgi:hypothetical protein
MVLRMRHSGVSWFCAERRYTRVAFAPCLAVVYTVYVPSYKGILLRDIQLTHVQRSEVQL